jgi:cellulose/xylan binding protein with CBM9 domain
MGAAILGGCIFGIRGLPAHDATPDLATPSDGAGAPADLASDAAMAAPDLLPDPCASSTPLDGGVAAGVCVIATAPPVIDGVLDDWTGVPFVPISFTTADVHVNTNSPRLGAWPATPAVDANLSAAFALRWDQANLYVAVRVTDDIRAFITSAITDSDSVELYLNADANPGAAADGPNAYQLSFTVDNRFAAFRDGNSISVPGGTTIAHATMLGSGGNWTLEVKIPWTLLGFASAGAGRVVGWDIDINDDDSGTQRDRWLVWKDAPLASGGNACMCNNGDLCLPYCDARNWGRLVLAGR